MEKSRDAFRTISEVAELLDTPAHVLRFWESRFPQVRPVKRAGGRRYYRPTDVALLSGIKRLLHSDGLTIRGVQKVLREHGIRHVMAMADASIEAENSRLAEPEPKPPADVLILGTPRSAMPKAEPSPELPLFAGSTEAKAPEEQGAPSSPEVSQAPAVWMPTLLRATSPETARQNRAALAKIARRLTELRDRMQPGTDERSR